MGYLLYEKLTKSLTMSDLMSDEEWTQFITGASTLPEGWTDKEYWKWLERELETQRDERKQFEGKVKSLQGWLIAVAIAAPVLGFITGVHLTTRGFFTIPFSVMQKQMHEIWDIPLDKLEPPAWREIDDKESNQ
jgi:hypothetical protein